MNPLDFSDPRFWLDAVQLLAIAALWLRKPGQDAAQRVEHVEAQLEVIKERMKHMPTDEELTQLAGTVRVIAEQISGLQGSVATTRLGVARIENFLLQQKP